MTITRLSSRTHALDTSFLAEHLRGARRYRRIAGYFTSSLFEVAGELIAHVPDVQIVCNADIQADDLKIARLAEARLLGQWNARAAVETDALLRRPRYQKLAAFLEQGHAVRVAPDACCGFVHGKAGLIDRADGQQIGLIGSMNETASGWQHHYEILWSDDSPEGVAWIEAEFDYLWRHARALPHALCREIKRRSRRHEVSIDEVEEPDDLAPAALVESPLYREGFALQPWQQGFVAETLRHYREYGVVRLLLADEVGLGKTLSMGTAALVLALLDEQQGRARPTVIFAPATLCEQWQIEMLDKLGVPVARWHTLHKAWVDAAERAISPPGAEHIDRCPLRIGIVSTGLMMRDSHEKHYLLGRRGGYGLVILDEAHKARTRVQPGRRADTPNNLLRFMNEIAGVSRHVILGTATPIQTRREDLWDSVRVLHRGAGGFVLGSDYSEWHEPEKIVPILSGQATIERTDEAWTLLRSPLPPVGSTREPLARKLYRLIREEAHMASDRHTCKASLLELDPIVEQDLQAALDSVVNGAGLFQRENPFVRHVVLRKRSTLEDAGLLERVAVDIHPDADHVKHVHAFNALFSGQALRTDDDFREAYEQAQAFGKALAGRGQGSGFMKNLVEQRVCSSIAAGLATAGRLLEGDTLEEETDDATVELNARGEDEIEALEQLIRRLQQVRQDPKMAAIQHYLANEGWLELGCIVFSQYYDTAEWVAESLAGRLPDEPIGLYAGAGKSRLYFQGDSSTANREDLKQRVADREIRLMIATDAACEGLNLQTLGTLINVDLPWNPTKLEQRLGRIKRFGQSRASVDMLNLVNQATVDEKVYDRLSERMRDKFDLFGSLPDTIKDDWIDDIEQLGTLMDQYIETQQQETGFDIRYNASLQPDERDWRECSNVLSRHDFETLMRKGWA